jgi:hypothetical protein
MDVIMKHLAKRIASNPFQQIEPFNQNEKDPLI